MTINPLNIDAMIQLENLWFDSYIPFNLISPSVNVNSQFADYWRLFMLISYFDEDNSFRLFVGYFIYFLVFNPALNFVNIRDLVIMF